VRSRLDAHSSRFQGGAIFVGQRGKALAYTDRLNEIWRIAHEKERMRHRVPYVCRHTRAAELLSRGVQPAKAAKELGHSVQMFLQIYSEFIEEYSLDDGDHLLESDAGRNHTNTAQSER